MGLGSRRWSALGAASQLNSTPPGLEALSGSAALPRFLPRCQSQDQLLLQEEEEGPMGVASAGDTHGQCSHPLPPWSPRLLVTCLPLKLPMSPCTISSSLPVSANPCPGAPSSALGDPHAQPCRGPRCLTPAQGGVPASPRDGALLPPGAVELAALVWGEPMLAWDTQPPLLSQPQAWVSAEPVSPRPPATTASTPPHHCGPGSCAGNTINKAGSITRGLCVSLVSWHADRACPQCPCVPTVRVPSVHPCPRSVGGPQLSSSMSPSWGCPAGGGCLGPPSVHVSNRCACPGPSVHVAILPVRTPSSRAWPGCAHPEVHVSGMGCACVCGCPEGARDQGPVDVPWAPSLGPSPHGVSQGSEQSLQRAEHSGPRAPSHGTARAARGRGWAQGCTPCAEGAAWPLQHALGQDPASALTAPPWPPSHPMQQPLLGGITHCSCPWGAG